MSDSLYNFEVKARLPVVPLSYDSRDLAKIREFIVDYTTGDAYVKTDSGELINICASKTTMENFAEYLKANPDIIANIIVRTPDGTEETIEATFAKFYEILDKIDTKSFLYAGSATDGGPATSAERLNHTLTIHEENKSSQYNGSANVSVDLSNYYKKTGGEINGDVTIGELLILTEGQMYGTELPPTGTEGQLFFLIADL